MSATSALSPSDAPTGRLPGVLGRSTAAVRTRYRRQTAALMIGTTVVGLWLGLAAPSVSPVAPVTATTVAVNLADVGAAAGQDGRADGPGPRRLDGRHGGHR